MAAAGGSKTPPTIYEMLLWLHGLGQNEKKTEREKLEEYIVTTLKDSLNGKFSSVSSSIEKITAEAKGLIETVCKEAGKILKSIKNGQKETSVSSGEFQDEISKLKYPEATNGNGKKLYQQFFYYLTCCFWQLRFLYLKCHTQAFVGGWKQCMYGSGAEEDSDKCTTGQHNGNNRCQTCSNNSGCLQAFLTAQPDNGKDAKKNIYTGAPYCPPSCQQHQNNRGSEGSTQCPLPPMGWPKNELSSASKSGHSLQNEILKDFFKDNSNSFPKLLGHLFALDLLHNSASQSSSQANALQVPYSWSLPHLFAFWSVFSTKWNGQKTEWKQKFQAELNGQGGGTQQYQWKPEDPDTLLEDFLKAYDSDASQHNNNDHNGLSTLTGCEIRSNGASSTTSTCGKYLHGILELPFHYVLEQFKSGGLFGIFMNHETIKEFAKKFHDAFNKFKENLQTQTCVTQPSCECIVWCDATHSCMYQHGITLNSSLSLAVMRNDGKDDTTNRPGAKERKCSDLNTQLGHVLKTDAPLWKLTQLEMQSVSQPTTPSPARQVAAAPATKADPTGGPGTSVSASPGDPTSVTNGASTAATGSTSGSSGPEASKPGAKPAENGKDGLGGTTCTVGLSSLVGGKSSSSTVSPSPPGTGGGTPGVSSTAGPVPQPPPPSGAASQAATPPTSTSGGKGEQRSASPGSVNLAVSNDNSQVSVSVSGQQNGGPSQRSDTTPGVGVGANGATPTTGSPGSSTGSVSGTTGTVNIRDNNRDGVVNWKNFKDGFDKVLKELQKVVNSGIDMSLKAIRQINAHHSSLLEPPCNVKECIDWLIRVGEMDTEKSKASNRAPSNANGLFAPYCILCFSDDPLTRNSNALQEAIKKLTGSQRSLNVCITQLIQQLSEFIGYKDGEISNTTSSPYGIATASYYSAYSLSAQWPTCGPATPGAASGAQCRCCKGNSCKCSTASSSSCDGSCCDQCDVRICAGIFIAMVPALDKALRELRDKLKGKKDNGRNGKMISSMTDIFEPFGFKDNDLSTTQWKQGYGPQSPGTKLTSAISKLEELKRDIKNAFENSADRQKRNGFAAPENSTAGATTASCGKDCASTRCSQPTSIREMLLWLLGLPYCEGYKQFVEQLKKKYKEHNKNSSTAKSSTSVNTADHYIHRQYSAVIFHLPVLFYTVEGTVSYLRDTFCQFTGDNTNCRTGTNTHCTTENDKHCTTGTNKNCTVVRFRYERCGCCLLRTFCAIVAVLYPVQRFLIKRCEAKSTARAATRRTHTKQTAQDKDCCAKCPSGLNDWSQLCVKGPSKDCKNSKDSSCCKDKKGSTPCTTSTVSVIRSACQCRALYDFVCFMGFRVGANVELRGRELCDRLKDCFGEQDEEAMESVTESKSRTVNVRSSYRNKTYEKLASCWRLSRCVLRSHCQKGDASPVCCDVCHVACSSKCSVPFVQDKALSPTSNTPTIRQMMLWLIGLPLTAVYKKDQDTVSTGQKSEPTAASGYMFGTNGVVSSGVQCIPALKKLEDDKAQEKAPKKGSKKESLKPSDLFKSYYKETIVWMLVVFNAIEGNLTSVLCYLRDHAPGTGASGGVSHCATGQKEASSSRACSMFTYEFNDPSQLLGAFCRYIYMVHAQLRFLLTMCSTPKADGGWRECHYALKKYSSGSSSMGTILCGCHEGIDVACANEPLRSFLTNNPQNKNRFQLCDDKKKEHLQMGFAVRECSSSLTGANIATVLASLIDPIGTSSSPPLFTRPLSLLTQYCVAIGQLEPTSLGDLFTVFGDVANGMWMTMYLYGTDGQTFSSQLLCELWSLFKCCQEGCIKECNKGHSCSDDCKDSNRDCARRYCLKLRNSISRVMARHKESRTTNDSDASHRYSLGSLMCSQQCTAQSQEASSVTSTPSPASAPQCSSSCAPYMKSLSQGLYRYYCPSVPGAGDTKSFGALQWLYDRLRQLLDGMKELKGAFEKCPCCQEKNTQKDSKGSSQSSCSDIVSCPYAHPTIYRFGFMLGDPCVLRGVNGNDDKQDCNKGEHKDKKSCASFYKQLCGVLNVPEGCCNKKCCKKDCVKCSVICSQQCTGVPSQASPCVPTSPVSALYLAFQCVITIVYRIMLKKALLKVQCTVEQWYKNNECNQEQQHKKDQECTPQNDNENALQCQLIGAFESYVTNAVYDSYPVLMCTFACQVFKENYNKKVNGACDVSHASRVQHCPCVHMAPGPRIITRTSRNRDCNCSKLTDGVQCSNASLCISKCPVTSITPIIPQYTAPVIDPFAYRVMQKATTTGSGGTPSCATSYDFQSALDFHVRGANCILPVPSNLRSAVDWILRVTVGALATKEKDNNSAVVCQERKDCKDGQRGDPESSSLLCDPEVQMFQCLVQEISCVLNGDQRDAEKKQCDTLSIVSQCQECNALSTCDGSSTVPNTSSCNSSCAQCLLLNLAQGLRTFVGYKDVTSKVKEEVCQKRDAVKGELCSLLECLKSFMCNEGVMSTAASSVVLSSQCSLLAELGNALLKGRYEIIKNDMGADLISLVSDALGVFTGVPHGDYFSDVLCIFYTALQSDHKQCHSDLRCNTLNKEKHCATTPATTTADTCATTTANTSKGFPQGLSLLCDFFQGIQRFACEWNHIGKGSASKGSEAQGCKKKGEQLLCCSQDCYLQNPCSQSCSKLCAFKPSSSVVFNERRKAECLPWTFNGQRKECHEKNCSQECPCKEPNKDCSTSLSSSSSSSPSCPRGFFQQLQCGLEALGQCATTVSELGSVSSGVSLPATGTEQCNTGEKNNDAPLAIEQYREKLCALIEALKRFGDHIQGCKFEGAPEGSKEPCENVCALNCNAVCPDGASQSNDSVSPCSPSRCSCRADASYAVDGAKRLIEATKKGVEKEITMFIKTEISNAYGLFGGKLRLASLLYKLESRVCHTVCVFKSHLDDLKRLCQWLYRMSQLYASGLKGFVESLVSHLEHIIQVIDWITGIERMIRMFGQECVSTAEELIDRSVLKCVPACCQRHKGSVKSEASDQKASVTKALCDQKTTCTDGTVMDSALTSITSTVCDPSVFFDALNCRIDNLLSSYVLGPLPKGTQKENDSVCSQGQTSVKSPSASSSVDRSCLFRAFLERLRLLAMDRYTLQLWQDESCPKDRVSSIRHWSVFRDGIIRHSDLEGIKRALCCLTQMEDYKGVQECGVKSSTTGQKDSSVQCSNVSSSAPSSASRIHNFHAICVIQKFSYEAPLRALQCSTEGLKKIKKELQKCKEGLQPLQKLLKEKDCHSRGVTSCKEECQASCKQECCKALSKDSADILKYGASSAPFCELYRSLCDFLCEPYGIYNLALFLHTILGPNAFSAAMFAIRDLRDILCQLLKKGIISEPKGVLQCNKDPCCLCRLMRRMCAIVSTLNGKNALRTLKDTVSCAQCNGNDDSYSLAAVTKRLEAFVDVLRREYIFCYPVVCGMKSDKDCNAVCPGESKGACSVQPKDASLACSSQSSVTQSSLTASHTSATSTLSLTSPMPLLCAHCHLSSSICPQCIPPLSRLFITLVPVLYPQLCYLAYQCRLYWQQDQMNGYKDSALSSLMRTFGFESKDLYDYLYVDVPFSGTHIYKVLCKEENSLRLLCDNFTKDTDAFPFNTKSPLFKLYHLCLAYYQRRKNERLTDSKSTASCMPTTLREILRFFVYLPFSAQFQSLQKVLRSYCSQSCVVHFSDIFTTLMMSSAMGAVLLQLIECPQGAFLCFFDDIYTNREGYHLDNNTETLFFQLCDLSVTLYRGLKFLSLQCSAERSLAGWKHCRLRGVKRNSDRKDNTQALDTQQKNITDTLHSAPHLCLCQSIGANDSSTTTPMCLNSDSSVSTQPSHTTCSFPLLRYLTDADCFFDSRRTVPSALRKVCLNDSCQEMIYRHMAPRGWEKETLQCAHRDEQSRDCDLKACSSVCHLKDSDPLDSNCHVSRSHPCCCAQCCAPVCSTLYGHDLFQLLRNFVGHEHDADPLLQFTRYMVAIAAWPPDSLSGYMTFMLRFSDQLRKEKNGVSGSVTQKNASQKNGVNSSVLSSLKSEISLFPGEFKPECLIGAFLEVTCCEHNNGAASSPAATPVASSSSGTSLSSQCPTSSVMPSVLRDCKDCKCIIYPVDYEIYDLYLPMYARRYLTWMLHFGPRLHRGMRALEKAFRRHIEDKNGLKSGACSTDPGSSHSGVSSNATVHSSIVQCPYAFPELHSAGLHFWDPNRMCNVSCECLLQLLQCDLKDSSTLAEFLSACDSFLWSVRKPFYWLTMALWIVATVYLLFVHLWRLDSWRLLSHVIRSRASHLVYPKVLLAAEQSYKQYYAPR